MDVRGVGTCWLPLVLSQGLVSVTKTQTTTLTRYRIYTLGQIFDIVHTLATEDRT